MQRNWIRSIAIMLIVSVTYFLLFQITRYHQIKTASAAANMDPIVLIDAGHGGEDGGASSSDGVLEKHINLQIALRLQQVMALLGVKTHMIRETDISVYTGNCKTLSEKKVSDLKNRVAMTEQYENPILVSIHQNHFSEARYSGSQIFYAPTEGSRDLAATMQSYVSIGVNEKNIRDIKPADSVYLLNHISCPGILVECGFLSNPTEAELLQQKPYQTRLSAVMGCAVLEYIAKGETPNEV